MLEGPSSVQFIGDTVYKDQYKWATFAQRWEGRDPFALSENMATVSVDSKSQQCNSINAILQGYGPLEHVLKSWKATDRLPDCLRRRKQMLHPHSELLSLLTTTLRTHVAFFNLERALQTPWASLWSPYSSTAEVNGALHGEEGLHNPAPH